MNRLVLVAIVALTGVMAFVVEDLLNPDSVPVARAVELSGVAPEPSPAAEGFFVVPPRVVDFSLDGGDDDGSAEPSGDDATASTTVPSSDPDDSPDDDFDDDFDSPDDSIDDDD